MTDEQKKTSKYMVLSITLALLYLLLNFKELSFEYLLTSASFIISMFILFRYLFLRKDYEAQGKETLLKQTKTLYLQLSVLFVIYAVCKIITTGNWRFFVLEGTVIAVLFLVNYLKLK